MAILMRRAAPLRRSNAVKVALPQDEFLNSILLCDIIKELNIDHVFSAAPESEWPLIYAGVDCNRVKFHRVLTGYLEEGRVCEIQSLSRGIQDRPIDIGYRAWHASPWLGRHGRLKVSVASAVEERAPGLGLVTDISTLDKDTLLDNDWYKFLLRCRYTVGAEGGSSILDRDGSIRLRTEAYEKSHPGASFEEIQDCCFPGQDGRLSLFALSPRHLEACATRTCQILVEGEYAGILEPWKHYIPLKRDLSNIDDVLQLTKDEDLRSRIIESAYRDVVASGAYTYRRFVERVLYESISGRERSGATQSPDAAAYRVQSRMKRADAITWRGIRLANTAHRALTSYKRYVTH